MKQNDNSFVIRLLDERFSESLVDLAACFVRLQIHRETDPLMPATEIQTPKLWDEEMDIVMTEDIQMIFYSAGCFMVSLSFDLARKYGVNSGVIVQYVVNRLDKIARELAPNMFLSVFVMIA